MAAAVFLGVRPTSGYRVEVLTLREESGRRVLVYRELAPAPDRMVSQVVTTPWVVVVVARSDLPLVSRPVEPSGRVPSASAR